MEFLHPACASREGFAKLKKGVFGAGQQAFIRVRRHELIVLDSPKSQEGWTLPLFKSKIRGSVKKGTILITARGTKYTLAFNEPADTEKWIESLYISSKWSLDNYYTMSSQILGSGQYGVVCKANMLDGDEEVAVKIVSKTQNQPRLMDFISREYAIIAELSHANIVRTLDVFEDDEKLALVMEVMNGGPLTNHVTREKPLCELDTAHVMYDLLSAVAYMHEKNVVHRDIKPDNILIVSNTRPVRAKVTDFGLANFIDSRFLSRNGVDVMPLSGVGTIQFAAPEVLRNEAYGISADMWSCGVVCYYMLSGRYPFASYHKDITKKNIKKCAYSFPDDAFGKISASAKDLINLLLNPEKLKRISARDALKHQWFKEFFISTPLQTKEYRSRSPRVPPSRLASSVDGGDADDYDSEDIGPVSMQGPMPSVSSTISLQPLSMNDVPRAVNKGPRMQRVASLRQKTGRIISPRQSSFGGNATNTSDDRSTRRFISNVAVSETSSPFGVFSKMGSGTARAKERSISIDSFRLRPSGISNV
mmetsp:Transcript_506/g.1735  ORF Transcript_506/g.1735 Transcript_506/m.1735 type:complete len:534 (-) Transcript_506:317-1918(-)|eukprot:CAMPEP_0198723368 /NCGR_PEP_ID=MMETSP1475-20131203/894_1 /TAXON_ID= ORGANISM="Unidentified sp., Strain CCMP1999" /NCGR_SAMPLE_ID=MMETSP1475 /ASSEMBLY_ACC=CAM_ASM_001111 /LENGTH=533 /DNA_ID=CAMNT_0044484473 /DNA_START=423 /DNA_END=2024 /DNA_ORIENTATION=-